MKPILATSPAVAAPADPAGPLRDADPVNGEL